MDDAATIARLRDWDLRRFDGRVAVVTGGSSGIGRATALRLAAEGAAVWLADRAAPEAGDPVLAVARFIRTDVTDPDSLAALACAVGPADVLVNAAGIAPGGTIQATRLQVWRAVLDVNLTGTFLAIQAVVPAMIAAGAGAIVNVGSDAALVGQTGQAAYCASKGGVVQLTRAAALDLAPSGIRVNCVCPCFVDTPLVERWIASQPDPAAARSAAAAEQPIGRMGQPQEIAAAIAFLASDEARFVTGAALAVDGGTTAR